MQAIFEPESEIQEETTDTLIRNLVVFNDDFNTFDWVIETLVEVCRHTPQQAEQCTLIIHFKGKCSVKEGTFEELSVLRADICRRGISAEIF